MKVSFLTTTHNHEKYIKRCIESVLAQKYPDVEQVIVDDGSADKTGEIARRYAIQNPDRIKYYRQDNIGVGRLAETYNFGLSKCSGEIIAILEGDDWNDHLRADYHVAAFQNPDVVLSHGATVRINDKGQALSFIPDDPGIFEGISRRGMARLMLKGCYISAVTTAIRRDALDKIGGFQPGAYYVDYPTWLALVPHGRFEYTDKWFSYWGVHADSYSSVLGPTATPEVDVFKAYRSWPKECQGVMTEEELNDHWQYVQAVRARSLLKNKILGTIRKAVSI